MQYGNDNHRPLAPGMGEAVAKRTVLRRREDLSLETWGDVANRVALGNCMLIDGVSDYECSRLRAHIANGSILLSGRHLQHGDRTQATRPMEVFVNCASAATSFLSYYLLLNGAGVGRCYDDTLCVVDWRKMPYVHVVMDEGHKDFDYRSMESLTEARHKYGKHCEVHEVEDSREGWAKAVELIETLAYSGKHSKEIVLLDFSKVRPSGSPIKGMQNRPSSGPVPTMNAIRNICTLKGSHMPNWMQAMYVDHYMAESVLVGGSRRSARIASKSWRDPDVLSFVKLKNNTKNKERNFLWSANNSVMVDQEFWDECEVPGTWAHQVFDTVATNAYEWGEPGIINQHKLVVNNAGLVDMEDGKYAESTRYKPSADAVKLLGRLAKITRTSRFPMIVNPCFHADTLVLTKTGPRRIADLVGQNVEVFDGKDWVLCSNFRVTGEDQELFTVRLHDGREITATAYHKFLVNGERVELKDLQVGDALDDLADESLYAEMHTTDVPAAYLKGFLLGDGSVASDSYRTPTPLLWLYSTKYVCGKRLVASANELPAEKIKGNFVKKGVVIARDNDDRSHMCGLAVRRTALLPWCAEYKANLPLEVYTWSLNSKREFIAGLFDADGAVMDSTHGFGYQLASVNRTFLVQILALLRTLGVYGKVSLMHAAGVTDFNDGYGAYKTQDCWRLTISQRSAIHLAKQVKFERLRSLAQRECAYNCKSRRNRVVEIVHHSSHNTVYCCTVDSTHNIALFNGILTGQCGEITLNTLGAYCSIGDVVPYFCDTIEEAEEAVKLTVHALIRVNQMNSVYHREVKRTNRIGVSLTGLHEFAWKFFKLGFRDLINEEKAKPFWMALARLARAVKDEACNYSRRLEVNVPHTNTTIKPAGTTSKLLGLTEGAHLPTMREYIRWVQFRNDDPLVQKYKRLGYQTRELKTYQGTTIVGFPTQPEICKLGLGENLVTAGEATPEEQYRWLMLLEKYWIRGVDENGSPLAKDTGNQISYTLKYDPEKVSLEQFRKTLREMQNQVKCCSIMRQSRNEESKYEYQPEQAVNLEDYNAYVRAIQSEVEEDIDKAHIECAGGVCPVDINGKKDTVRAKVK
jgi:ribonucleotide reductase alpha subunit